MTARAPRILMAGTAPEGRGGVAALVVVLRDGSLFEEAAVRDVSTQREGSFLAKPGAAAHGFCRAIACRWGRRPIVDAHAASHVRFARAKVVLLLLLLWLARCAGCQAIFHLHGGGVRQFATVRSSVRGRRARRAAGAAGVSCLPSARRRLADGAAGDHGRRQGGTCKPPRPHSRSRARRRTWPAGAAAPVRMLEDDGLRARLGDGARTRAAEHNSTETVCSRLAAIYNDLAGA
jgi:hypothetical protein